jgi:alkylation response protein AidB-like acyl-CoA dehydrogenase
MALESIDGYLGKVCDDWSTGVDHGMDWPVKIICAKHFAVTQAWKVVDTAFDLSGGAGIFKRSRIEQLFRDARLGRVHPGNSLLMHELVGKMSLGINPDEQPRWG